MPRIAETKDLRRTRSSLMNAGLRVDYAVRALVYMAGQPPEKVVGRAEIQKKQDIPTHLLSKILKKLVEGGILESRVGPKGGFVLKRSPQELNVREIFECIEGHMVLMGCLEHREIFCRYLPVCTQAGIWAGAQEALGNYLSSIYISDIVDRLGLTARLTRTDSSDSVSSVS